MHRTNKRWTAGLAGLLLASTLATGALADAPAKATDIRPLLIGSSVPNVELQQTDGSGFNLADAAKADRLIILFYRGGW
jgi:hypothetical protein